MKYTENAVDLANRIRAHKLYSKAAVEPIIAALHGGLRDQSVVLDLGCGNGNYFPLLRQNTKTYVGLDVSEGLLLEFSRRYAGDQVLIRASMDQMPDFIDGTFDAVYSVYSIYYAERPIDLIATLHRLLKHDGQLVILGPGTSTHAPEIETFIQYVAKRADVRAGIDATGSRNKNVRIETFHSVIVPAVVRAFGKSEVSELDTSLVFPDSAEWARYVVATPEVVEFFQTGNRDALEAEAQEFSEATACRTISKTMMSVVAHK